MRKAFRIFLYVTLAYLLLTILVLPPVLNHQLKKIHLQQTGRELQLEGSWFNPLSLELGLEQAAVDDPDGERFWAFEELSVDFSLWGTLFGQGIRFDGLVLDGLELHLREQKPGQFNFIDIVEHMASMPAPEQQPETSESTESFAIAFTELSITAKRLQFSDLSRAEPFSAQLSFLQLSTSDFSTVGDEPAEYQLLVRSGQGGSIKSSGKLLLSSQSGSGDLNIEQLNLIPAWQFLSPGLAFRLQSGELEAGIDYRASWADGFSLSIDNSRAALAKMDIAPITESSLPNQIIWDELSLDGIAVGTDERQVTIEKLQWRGLDLESGHYLSDNGVQVALTELFVGGDNTVPETTSEESQQASGEPWTIALNTFQLPESRVAWHAPELGDQPVILLPLTIEISDISWPERSPLTMELEGAINSDGRVNVSGELSPQSLQGQLLVALQAPLPLVNGMLQQSMAAEIQSGVLQTELTLSFAEQSLAAISGSAGINDFTLINSNEQTVLNWSELAVADIDVSMNQQQLQIGRISLKEPFAKLHIDAEGVTNLQALSKADPSQKPQQSDEATEADSAEPGWHMIVSEIALEQGKLDFADQSLALPFTANIDSFGGAIRGFDSKGTKPAEVNLKGLVDEYAPIALTGSLGPMSPQMALDLAFDFEGLEMAGLSPYSGTYVGRAIDQGQLNINLKYELQDNRLKGQNRVQIKQLSLGDKVDSPDAVQLPLGAAVALLKDINGVIKLNVPVSGDLNDPSFTLGSVVWSAFQNLILKTVASPFKLLGSLVGSDDDLQRIPFAPGAVELNELAQKKLQQLSEALAQRPGLKISLQGQYDPERDLLHLQQQRLVEQLQQRGVGPESVQSKDEKWSSEIRRLYSRQFTDRPTADRLTGELYDELVAAEQIAVEELVALANARADSARKQLVEALSVATDRVVVKEAKEKSNDGSQVQLDVDL